MDSLTGFYKDKSKKKKTKTIQGRIIICRAIKECKIICSKI